MTTQIRTTHVGSLPRTDALIAANKDHQDGALPDADFEAVITEAVDSVIARQASIGIDIVNDGEYGHLMTQSVDYGAWWGYSFLRFSGLEVLPEPPARRPSGKLELDAMTDRRDWAAFADAYADPTSGIHIANRRPWVFPTVTGPLSYTGADLVARDIALTKRGLEAAGKTLSEGFVAALSPASAARVGNTYYEDDEAAVWAWAEALREEYKAIADAGLTVQIDAPDLAESWDQFVTEPSLELQEVVEGRQACDGGTDDVTGHEERRREPIRLVLQAAIRALVPHRRRPVEDQVTELVGQVEAGALRRPVARQEDGRVRVRAPEGERVDILLRLGDAELGHAQACTRTTQTHTRGGRSCQTARISKSTSESGRASSAWR